MGYDRTGPPGQAGNGRIGHAQDRTCSPGEAGNGRIGPARTGPPGQAGNGRIAGPRSHSVVPQDSQAMVASVPPVVREVPDPPSRPTQDFKLRRTAPLHRVWTSARPKRRGGGPGGTGIAGQGRRHCPDADHGRRRPRDRHDGRRSLAASRRRLRGGGRRLCPAFGLQVFARASRLAASDTGFGGPAGRALGLAGRPLW